MLEKLNSDQRAKVARIILGDDDVYLRPYAKVEYVVGVTQPRTLWEKLTFKRTRTDFVRKTQIIHAMMEPKRESMSKIVFRFPPFVAPGVTTVESYTIVWFGQTKKTDKYLSLEPGDQMTISYSASL